MKFRTEIEPFTLDTDIDYRSRLLALGSCFAEHIAARLSRARFRIEANPTGILFNPASIVRTLERLWHAEPVRREELHRSREGVWFHYDFHGSLSRTEADEALDAMNEAVRRGAEALHGADTLLLTFGTAWVYDHEGRPVANCHRQPAAEFHRRRMTVEEIVAPLARLLEGELAAKRLIVSVSPVRHAGDGLVENSLSKATLRLAAAALEERFAERVRYFPAYEMLVDDLRDYRFYAEDLVHPSPQTVEYVWEHFTQAALSERARRLLPEVERIVRASEHRMQHPRSEACRAFCRQQLAAIEALPEVDFTAERAYFSRFLK